MRELGLVACASACIGGVAAAQAVDLSVSEISSIVRRGAGTGPYGFAPGFTICNRGSGAASFVASTNQHPIVGWSIYRIDEERLEQIGVSWMFHTFAALNTSLCGTCQGTNLTAAQLGAGCSSPESANITAASQALGPRFEVDASDGTFAYPFSSPGGTTGDAIYKLAQVRASDLVLDATYVIETQIVHPQDSAHTDNTSYRMLMLAPATLNLVPSGGTFRGASAIDAWRANARGAGLPDESIVVARVGSAGDGEFIVGSRAIDLGGGRWRYVYAVENVDSSRGVRELLVPAFPANVSNATFHDVAYHSGEPFDGTDWTFAIGEHARWSTATFQENQHANAIRFGTTYTFSFESSATPRHGLVTLGLFAPGVPGVVITEAWTPTPGCAADLDDGSELGHPDGALTIDDLLFFLRHFELGSLVADLDDDGDPSIANPDGAVTIADLVFFLVRFEQGC